MHDAAFDNGRNGVANYNKVSIASPRDKHSHGIARVLGMSWKTVPYRQL